MTLYRVFSVFHIKKCNVCALQSISKVGEVVSDILTTARYYGQHAAVFCGRIVQHTETPSSILENYAIIRSRYMLFNHLESTDFFLYNYTSCWLLLSDPEQQGKPSKKRGIKNQGSPGRVTDSAYGRTSWSFVYGSVRSTQHVSP